MPATPASGYRHGMEFKFRLASAFAAALTAVSVALAPMPLAEQCEIGPWVQEKNFSVGMPAHPSPEPNGSLVMEFPVAKSGEVDALTMGIGPLAGAREITLRCRVEAGRGTPFIAHETPGEPARVSLYFQQAGDNWSGRGRFASYRWYSPARGVVPLEPGQHAITVQIDEAWTNVNAQSSHALPDGYAAVLQDTARIGLAFGSSSRLSHGAHSTGPARFELLGLDMN
jgi:hypothetical protein